MKELPFWALFFSLEDEADIANTTHFCEVWKRQEFEVPPSAFGHSQHHSASSSSSCCLGGLGICKFLFQDPAAFRAGEEFARLSGPDAAVRKCCSMPRYRNRQQNTECLRLVMSGLRPKVIMTWMSVCPTLSGGFQDNTGSKLATGTKFVSFLFCWEL